MIGVLIITLTGLILSIILVLTDLYINKKDLKKDEYLRRLPGYNCGACGFGSCSGMADAMCKDINNYKKCRPLRGDKLKEMEDYLKSLKNK